jgi:hypothetical protein
MCKGVWEIVRMTMCKTVTVRLMGKELIVCI